MGLFDERGLKNDLCVSVTTLAESKTQLTGQSLQYGIVFAAEIGFESKPKANAVSLSIIPLLTDLNANSFAREEKSVLD